MPDENRFAGLSEKLGGSEDSDAESDVEHKVEPEPEATDDTTDSGTTGEGTSEDETDEDDSVGGPAFEFDETTAKSIYVRPETIDVLEDAEFDVEGLLRNDDIRDLTGREFQDALIHVAAEHTDEIAALIAERRDG